MRALHLALLCIVAAIGGAWIVLLADWVTVTLRGGGGSVAFIGFVAGAVGGAAGLALGGLAAVGDAIERWRGWAPGRILVGALSVLFAGAMYPAHHTLSRHPLGAWLSTGYAFGAALLVGGLLRRAWLAERRGLRPALAGIGLGGVILAHWVNAHLFAGLYPALHQALTAVCVALAGGALALLIQGRRRLQLGLLGIAAAWAVVGGLAYDPLPTRTSAYFKGTELGHAFDVLALISDGDGDGVARPGIGPDCDDTDPKVHPLRYEIPGNGVDDNCRLGDAPREAPPPEPPAPPSAALTAWRAAHPDANVLLLFIDTLRADHVTPELTPTLWALAERGVRFRQARTTVPRTPHAWTSLVTARYPSRILNCRKHLQRITLTSLVGRLRSQGLHTIGRFVGNDFQKRKLINHFDEVRARDHVARHTGDKVTRDVLALIEKAPGRFFAVAHYADPHAPYRPPAGFAVGTSLRERYAGEVRATDHQIKLLLDALERRGTLEKTVIVAIADHGENLGDHGDLGGHHGVSVYDEVLHVPLIVAGPGIAPLQVDAPVSLADVAPTILAITGGRALPGADGRSLAGYLVGDPPPEGFTISEFYDFGHRLRAIVMGRHKLIDDLRHGVRQLFDVQADPGELVNLLATQPERAAELQNALDIWIERVADPEEPAPLTCTGL